MTEITLILKDDGANPIEKSFVLTGDLDSLDGIDEAVEHFKNEALPQIEQELLSCAQERALQEEKKTLAGL